MGIWDTYENRVYVQGKTKREAALFRTSRRLSEKLGDSLSYHGVLIDGEERSVIIDDSDNLTIGLLLRKMQTMNCEQE